jgi:phosphate/phosphite/phosphonate ABC transporter binding protein
MQCVNTCPNETIVYSLRKKAADTGRVVGYLAAIQTKAADLPRYALTGFGVCAGAYLGFIVLPPSYFHTYAMFSSLGGLVGFLVYRLSAPLFTKWLPETAQSQVEKERAERLVPLSPEERLKRDTRAPQVRRLIAAVGVMLFLGALASVAAISHSVPPRIGALDELPASYATVEARTTSRQLFLGVPTETSAERTQHTYAGLRDVLRGQVADDVRLWRAESYGALAVALEHEKIDAAFLPAASAHALLKRKPVHVIAQTIYGGETTYTGMLVARDDLTPTPEGLTGARVALGQMDSLSGYLAPVWWLQRQGVQLTDLGEVVFASNHSQAVTLLASGRVDVAATFEMAMKEYREKNPDTKFQVLKRFNKLPNAVLVTRASMSEADGEKLLRALQAVWSDGTFDHARQALAEGAAMDGLAKADASALSSVDSWLP